jgi:hypothetical protein
VRAVSIQSNGCCGVTPYNLVEIHRRPSDTWRKFWLPDYTASRFRKNSLYLSPGAPHSAVLLGCRDMGGAGITQADSDSLRAGLSEDRIPV